MSRRAARKKAFFIIYQIDFHEDFDLDETYNYILELDDEVEEIGEKDKEFIYTEVSGTYQNLKEIDEIISKNCKKWTFDRLKKIDVAILRLAIYEMLYIEDIPKGVSINEAVELAKLYGDDDAPGFINGLLGKIV